MKNFLQPHILKSVSHTHMHAHAHTPGKPGLAGYPLILSLNHYPEHPHGMASWLPSPGCRIGHGVAWPYLPSAFTLLGGGGKGMLICPVLSAGVDVYTPMILCFSYSTFIGDLQIPMVILWLGVCLVNELVMAVWLPPGFIITFLRRGQRTWIVCWRVRVCLTGFLHIGACGPNDKW